MYSIELCGCLADGAGPEVTLAGPPPGGQPATLADLAAELAARDGVFARHLAAGRVRAFLDESMAPLSTPVPGGARIAFFPPVSGG